MTHPQDTPANPAQVTDAMVNAALDAYCKKFPLGVEPHHEGMRAALTAAIGAGAKSIDGDIMVEAVDGRVCLILCSDGDGLTAILDEERATELRDKLNLAIGAGGQAVAKPLEWERLSNGNLRALGAFGYRYIVHARSGSFLLHHASSLADDQFETEEAAKAAAQSDYERRIRSAIAQPHPADGRVVEALREKIAAIPQFDRGYSWEQSDYRGVEAIRAYGPIAAMCKFVLDNTEDLLAALSAKEGRS